MKKLITLSILFSGVPTAFADSYTIKANFSSKIKENDALVIKTNLLNQKNRRVPSSTAEGLFFFTNDMVFSQYSDSSCFALINSVSLSDKRSGMTFTIPPNTLSIEGTYAKVGNFLAGISTQCLPLEIKSSNSTPQSITLSIGTLTSGKYPVSGELKSGPSGSGFISAGFNGSLTASLVQSCDSQSRLSKTRVLSLKPKNGSYSFNIPSTWIPSGTTQFGVKVSDKLNSSLSKCETVSLTTAPETISLTPPKNFQLLQGQDISFQNHYTLYDGTSFVEFPSLSQDFWEGYINIYRNFKDKTLVSRPILGSNYLKYDLFFLNPDKTLTKLDLPSNITELTEFVPNSSISDSTGMYVVMEDRSRGYAFPHFYVLKIIESPSGTGYSLSATKIHEVSSSSNIGIDILRKMGDESKLVIRKGDYNEGTFEMKTLEKDTLAISETWSPVDNSADESIGSGEIIGNYIYYTRGYVSGSYYPSLRKQNLLTGEITELKQYPHIFDYDTRPVRKAAEGKLFSRITENSSNNSTVDVISNDQITNYTINGSVIGEVFSDKLGSIYAQSIRTDLGCSLTNVETGSVLPIVNLPSGVSCNQVNVYSVDGTFYGEAPTLGDLYKLNIISENGNSYLEPIEIFHTEGLYIQLPFRAPRVFPTM